jgi:competence protein ComEA
VAAIDPGADVPPAAPEAEAARLDLNAASYDELRALKLSVTQTGRILSHRERSGGFTSIEELEEIPGFSRATLDELRARLTV